MPSVDPFDEEEEEAFSIQTLAELLRRQLELQQQHLKLQEALLDSVSLNKDRAARVGFTGEVSALSGNSVDEHECGTSRNQSVSTALVADKSSESIPQSRHLVIPQEGEMHPQSSQVTLQFGSHKFVPSEIATFSRLTRWIFRLQGLWPEENTFGKLYHACVAGFLWIHLLLQMFDAVYVAHAEGEDIGHGFGELLRVGLSVGAMHYIRWDLRECADRGQLCHLLAATGRGFCWRKVDRVTLILYASGFVGGLSIGVAIVISFFFSDVGRVYEERVENDTFGAWYVLYKYVHLVFLSCGLPVSLPVLFSFASIGYLRACLHCYDFEKFVLEVEDAMCMASTDEAIERLQRAELFTSRRLAQTSATWGRLTGLGIVYIAFQFLIMLTLTLEGDSADSAHAVAIIPYMAMCLLGGGAVCIFSVAARVADCWRLEIADKLNTPKVLLLSQPHFQGMAPSHFGQKWHTNGIRIFGMMVDSNGVSRLAGGLALTLMLTFLRSHLSTR